MVTACTSSPTSSPSPIAEARPPSSAAVAAVENQITSPPSIGSAPAAVAVAPLSRVLLVGDSTLLAVERYRALGSFRGFDYVYSAESCRTLGVPSCGDPPVPPNALEAILAADGQFDHVVVMAGYDEWWTSFPQSFDLVVQAARSKGARHIIWLTYREGVGYVAPDGSSANEAFVRNNQTLRDKIATGEYPDVLLADWYRYSGSAENWLANDGIHLKPSGARGVADYISRWIAYLEGRPCPMPWAPGGPIDAFCPNPDLHEPVSDIDAMY